MVPGGVVDIVFVVEKVLVALPNIFVVVVRRALFVKVGIEFVWMVCPKQKVLIAKNTQIVVVFINCLVA